MNDYNSLCENLVTSLQNENPKDVFMKFFRFPERNDFISIIRSNLNVLCTQGNATQIIFDVYNLLNKIIENPEALTGLSINNKEYLLSLFRIEQLGYKTTSVEYVDGKLKYCSNQSINDYIFGSEFLIDKLNTLTYPMLIINNLIKTKPNEDVIVFLKDRLKILKKVIAVLSDSDSNVASVKVDRKNTRLKVTTSVTDNVLNITVN